MIIQVNDCLKNCWSTCLKRKPVVMPEKNKRWVATMGKKNKGWSFTNNMSGKPSAAPPKPKPARTKPDQTKIPLMSINSVLLKSIMS